MQGDLNNLLMSSTKSSIGHLLGAAGAVESIFSILSLNQAIIPPTFLILNMRLHKQIFCRTELPYLVDSFILITHSYTVFKSSSIPSETNDVVDLNTRFACLKPVARVHSEPRSNSNFNINICLTDCIIGISHPQVIC